jgi:hypothetical protein
VPDVWAREVERPLARSLWRRLLRDQPRRFQVVLGPRRVGKTTALYQTIRNLLREGIPRNRLWWLRLDHPLLMRVEMDILVQLVQFAVQQAEAAPRDPAYLFLDELTYAKDWDLWLKTFYDEAWPVRILASSSSTAALRDRRLESGVGRWDEQYLAPYLFGEFLELTGEARPVPVRADLYHTLKACVETPVDVSDLDKRRTAFLLTGGFPELLNRGGPREDLASALLQSQRVLRSDAIERAVYKDIPQVFGVDSPLLLERLLYTLAGQVTGILSPNAICQGLDRLSQPTFDRYLSYLEKAFLVFTLPNYSGTEATVQRRGRKLYFVDGAVRNAALQRGLAPVENEREMGVLLENMAAGHLHALAQQTQVRLYHWRHKEDEVDLVYDHPDRPMAFEIGAAGHSARSLLTFAEKYPRFRGCCFLVSPEARPRWPEAGTLDEVGRLPLDLFLLAVSAQAATELERNLLGGEGARPD